MLAAGKEIRDAVDIVSLVEKGWAGARRLSITMVQEGHQVHHLVRGRIPRNLLEVITPYPGITIRGYPAKWYRVAVWMILARAILTPRRTVVLVDNDRAESWVKRQFPRLHSVILVRETPEGQPIVVKDRVLLEGRQLLDLMRQ